MVTYIIASKARSQFLAEVQALGEFLEKNCPGVSVKMVIKHKKEWAEFLDATCRTYGFSKRSCPLIYTIEGTLIGDAPKFIEHVKEKYQRAIAITKDTQKRRTQQNIKMINEYMRKKKEGLNLGEKIIEHLNKIKDKDLISLIDDAFFVEEIDQGVPFMVRRTNLLRDKRTLNIIDEIEEKEKLQRALEEVEASRDMSYDEFIAKYAEMIDGTGSKSYKGRDYDDKSSHSRPVTGHPDEEGKSEHGVSEKRRAKASGSAMSKGSHSGVNTMNNTKEGFDIKDDLKYDIPESCFQILMKGNKIAKLDKKYKLLSHPYPILEGEMILFQPLKQDQYDKHYIVYRDYSLRKRIPSKIQNKKLTSYQQKQLEKEDEENTRLRSLEIDLFTPLSYIDWKNFAEVITEVQGLGWVQILPVFEKSSQPFQYQLMHILPNSKIPFANLPLDILISNKSASIKKIKDSAMEEISPSKKSIGGPSRGADLAPADSNFFSLEEFDFPHVVALHESALKAEPLIATYRRCYTVLDLEHHLDSGITIIVTPKWMFVATLTGPYCHHNNMPVYIDGYAYTGIINAQVVEQEWPATAGLVDRAHMVPFEILEKSSRFPEAQ